VPKRESWEGRTGASKVNLYCGKIGASQRCLDRQKGAVVQNYWNRSKRREQEGEGANETSGGIGQKIRAEKKKLMVPAWGGGVDLGVVESGANEMKEKKEERWEKSALVSNGRKEKEKRRQKE